MVSIMTHVHEDTCTVLSLTGLRQGKSNLERIIKWKGFKLEWKSSVK